MQPSKTSEISKRRPSRPARPAARALAAVLPLALAACTGEPTPPNGTYEPTLPDYIVFGGALGVWQELEKAARVIPPYLYDLPPLDGRPPFATQRLRDVPFRETPQRTLTLDIHRPVDAGPALRRAIVLYSGGGFVVDRDFDTLTVWADYLASRGFVVFNTRHRLLLEEGVTRRDVFSDAISAAQFVCARAADFGADPDRIGLLGRSSGGQLVLLIAMVPHSEYYGPTAYPDVPLNVRAVVDLFGPTDDRRFFITDDFSLLPRSAIAAVYGGTPDEVPKAYAESAAVELVRPGLPPIMLVHGALDTTIPPVQSVILADLLNAAGNEVIRAFFPDFGHVIGWGLFNNDGFGKTMMKVIPFFEQRL